MTSSIAFAFNGFLAGHTLATLTGFCVSPVRMIREGSDAEIVEVCSPQDRTFWSIYAATANGWRLVHEAGVDDAGRALLALSRIQGATFQYADTTSVIAATPLSELPARLAQRIHDDIAGDVHAGTAGAEGCDAHPLADLHNLIVEALTQEGMTSRQPPGGAVARSR